MEWFTRVFDELSEFSSSPWFYLIIFAVALIDAVIPIAPSESIVIVGGVAAGLGNLWLPMVIATAALGAVAGDNIAYAIGRSASGFVDGVAARRPRWKERLAWADEQIVKRGGALLIVARFIPGGRTALTTTCGLTGQPHPWFLAWDIVAGVIWALYAALLGYVGGRTFEDNHTAAFLVAFGGAIVLAGAIELVRRFLEKRSAAINRPS